MWQHEKARRYITRLSTDDSDGPFALYVQWCQEDPRCERHSLIDLITQPLQRLTRYPLLLKAILKYMSGRNPNRYIQPHATFDIWTIKSYSLYPFPSKVFPEPVLASILTQVVCGYCLYIFFVNIVYLQVILCSLYVTVVSVPG